MPERIEIITAGGHVFDLWDIATPRLDRGINGDGAFSALPGLRGSDIVVPGSHGEQWVPKLSEPADLALSVWVRGVNPDGTVPEDEAAVLLYRQNLRALLALFRPRRPFTIRHTLTDGSTREIQGEAREAITPDQRLYGRWVIGEFTVPVRSAYPFWLDADATGPLPVASGAPVMLGEWAGATAPTEHLLITFGPGSNPRFRQPSTDLMVGVNRVITTGQTVTVNTGTWEVYGTGGVGGGLYEALVYRRDESTRWMVLHPGPGAPGDPPVVEVTHTGPGTCTATVTGRRAHLIS